MATFVTTDKVRLNYTDQGDGTVVLLLAGFGSYQEIWLKQVQALTAVGYRVITMDQRNHGASEQTKHGLRISRLAVDVHELVTSLQISALYLVGNSMGAAIGYAYLSLFGEASVLGLVNIDQSPKMVADAHWHYGFKDLTWDTFPKALIPDFGKALGTEMDEAVYQALKQAQQNHPFDKQLTLPLLIDHAAQDWRDILHRFKIPHLYVIGEKSPYFPSTAADEATELISTGEVLRLPLAGHLGMVEQPTVFNQRLLKFLEK